MNEYVVFLRMDTMLTTAYVEAEDVEAAVETVLDKLSRRDMRELEEIRTVPVSEMHEKPVPLRAYPE